MYTRARLRLASSGPITQMEARISRTKSGGAWMMASSSGWSSRERSSDHITLTPRPCRISVIVSTSIICGTLRRMTFPEVSRHAAIMGSAAFFAPLTVTSP